MGEETSLQFDPVLAESDLIISGIVLTLWLSAAAILLGCTLAVLLVALRTLAGRWAGIVVDAYVELMRNTPFLIQLFMIFFGLPLLGIRMSGVEAALLTMTLNLGAYSTEIIRAGIDSIHKSQLEAGLSLALLAPPGLPSTSCCSRPSRGSGRRCRASSC